MKMFVAILRVVALVVATAVASAAADTNTVPPEQSVNAVPAAKVVRIEVEQEFGEASDVKLPFADVARDVFALVGQQVVEKGDTPLVLKVEAHGEALGGNYTGTITGYHYSGASLSGDLTLEMDGKKVAGSHFERQVPAAYEIHTEYPHPSDAPFDRTIGGYQKGLFELLTQTHGLEPLVNASRTGGWDLRQAAILALGGSGRAEAVPPLITLLTKTTQHNESLRAVTALALGRLGDARALPALIAAMDQGEASLPALERKDAEENWRATLQPGIAVPDELPDDETDARNCILAAVMHIDAPDKVERLLAALRDESSAMRRTSAAQLLGHMDAKTAEPALIEALRDKSFAVRAAAAGALGELRAVSAVEALSTASKDANAIVRATAEESLGNIGSQSGEQLLRLATRQAEGPIHDIPLEKLAEQLRTGNRLLRNLTVEQLLQRDDPAAKKMELLELALKDEWEQVRAAAVAGLPAAKDVRVQELLVEASKDKEAAVRIAAAGALTDSYANAELLDTFARLLKDEEEEVRRSAVSALGKIHEPRSVELLSAFVRDAERSYPVLEEVVDALGEIGDRRAVPVLLDVLQGPHDPARLKAVSVLGALGDKRAVEPLIALLETEEKRTSPAARESEENMESPEDTELNGAAVEALTAITKQDFAKAAEWRRWWTENREKFTPKP